MWQPSKNVKDIFEGKQCEYRCCELSTDAIKKDLLLS